MARLVRHAAQSPAIIKEGSFPIAVCACGLSRNLPYCDGSHKRTRDEEEGKEYRYDEAGNRTEV